MAKTRTAWLVKYALTDEMPDDEPRIYPIEGTVERDPTDGGKWRFAWRFWKFASAAYLAIGTEVFLTKDEAIAHAERMRRSDLEFHRQEIERLENLEF